MKDQDKNRWNKLNSRLNDQRTPDKTEPREGEAELVDPSGPPRELSVPQSSLEPTGLLAQFREGARQNAMTAEVLKAQREAQLKVLKSLLQKAAMAADAHADLLAKQYLMQLDSEYLQLLKFYRIQHAQQKAELIFGITEQIVAWLDKISACDWPEFLVNETIDKFLVLREREIQKFMHDLGT